MIYVLMLLAGCTKAPTILSTVDWEATPRLPSPSAGTYARVQSDPPDPGVRQVLGGRNWDESLGGAAAGIALSLVHRRGQLTAPEVREAAWRAGWPYPVRSVHTAGASSGSPAPQKVKEQLAKIPEEADVGLVRARSDLDKQDIWVLLSSIPRKDIGVFPRQLGQGGRIMLPTFDGVQFAVADPAGNLYEGHLSVGWSIEATIDGEWLIEMSDQEGVLARFPIYVNMVPPQLSLLSAGEPPGNAQVAANQVQEVLSRVRDAYGLRPSQVDTLLQNAVRWAQSEPSLTATSIGRRVGFEDGNLWRYDCTKATVELCLDPLVWDPRVRPYLLASSLLLGVGADIAPNGVHVTVLLGTES